jgi:hypothetical protein
MHEGCLQSGTPSYIDGCECNLAGSPIAGIDRQPDEVHLVISAHTYAAYIRRLPGASGGAIPVSSAACYCRVLADIDSIVGPNTRYIAAASPANRRYTHHAAETVHDIAALRQDK